MARMLLLAVSVAALVFGVVLFLRAPRDGATVVPTTQDLARDDADRAPGRPLANVVEPGARSSAAERIADDRTILGNAPGATTVAAADLVLVRVVEGASSAGMADAEVSIQAGVHPLVYAVTDEQGEFDFPASAVPARLGDRVSVVVKDEDGHVRLRDGVRLSPNVVLRVPPKSVLRGEIALESGESPEWLYVSMWSRGPGESSGETFVGYQNLGRNGRFAIPALGVPPPDFVRIEVARTGLPVSLRMSTTEMLVAPGPRIVVGLVLLQIAVVDGDGAPVPEALVRCTTTSDLDSADGSDRMSVDPSTGLDGRARLWVPAGPLTIVAGSKGYAPVLRAIHAESSALEIELRLRKLTDADRLRGTVVYEDGTPVLGLEVRGWSGAQSSDLARVTAALARTDGEGRFELPIALDQDVHVQANDLVSRQTGFATWRPGDRSVRLVIDRGQALSIQARGLPTAATGDTGRIEVVLVSERGVSDSLETDTLPVSFDHVPGGRWSVFAFARGPERWARGEVYMTRDAPEELTLDFESVEYVSGLVQLAPGAQRELSVAFTPVGWPSAAVEALLIAEVRADGTFRVPAPAAGEIVLRENYRTIERRPAVGGGAPLLFTLPD